MGEAGKLLFEIFLIFLIAKVAGEILEWIRIPSVIGELSVGILVGPSLLNLIHHGEVINALAEIGIVMLMFKVGLESKLSELIHIGKTAFWVALSGVILPFILGFGITYSFGYRNIESMFLGTAMVATSIGITAQVLGNLGVLGAIESKIILSAAVIDDILGMVVLAIVSGVSSGTFSYLNLAVIIVETGAFLGIALWISTHVTKQYKKRVATLRSKNSVFITSILFCLGLAVVASYIRLASIIGAFIAGIILSDATEEYDLDDRVDSITDFLVPFFFVLMGSNVNIQALTNWHIIGFGLLITFLAILGKLIGCGLAARKYGRKSALIIGWGMVPRGEVGLIVAAIGLSTQILPNNLYIDIIFMSILTTTIAPWIIQYYFRQKPDKINHDNLTQ
jgi:Kef-type K+ transport system membrane component KefB